MTAQPVNHEVRELRLALEELLDHPIPAHTLVGETAAEVRAAAAELKMLRAQTEEIR